MENDIKKLWPWPETEEQMIPKKIRHQNIETIEDFLIPRYEVLINFPGSRYEIGDIIIGPRFEFDMGKYPGVFRKMEWHEQREISDLMKVKFVMVNKNSYYTAGDVVPVFGYKLDTRNPNPKFLAFWVGDDQNHPFNPEHVLPRTEEEYDTYEVLRKNGVNRM